MRTIQAWCRRHGRRGLMCLVMFAGHSAGAAILEIAPTLPPDAPDALRVVNLSKMPATLHTLTLRIQGSAGTRPCVVTRQVSLTVAPGASVLVPAAQHAELMACLHAGRHARAKRLAGFSSAGAAPRVATPRIAPSLRGATPVALEIDAEFDVPQRRVSEMSRLNLLYR